MSQYIKKLPEEPTFRKEGFNGYCYPLENSNMSITLEDSYQKHDTYCTNVKKPSIYYVTEGEGKFIINHEEYEVKKGDIVEIPANIEFTYVGRMKLLFISVPAYTNEDFVDGRLNEG